MDQDRAGKGKLIHGAKLQGHKAKAALVGNSNLWCRFRSLRRLSMVQSSILEWLLQVDDNGIRIVFLRNNVSFYWIQSMDDALNR